MDEILFENRYTDDDETTLEVIRHVILGTFFNDLSWWKVFLLAALTIVSWLTHAKALFISLLVIDCLIVFIMLFAPRIYMNSYKKESLRLNSGATPESIIRFGDNILLTEGAISITTEYTQIIEIRHLKRSIALMTGSNTCITLKPDAFTIGSCEDCLAFLEEKCPNLGNSPVTRKNKLTRRQLVTQIIGCLMLGSEIGVFYGFHLVDEPIPLTLPVCAAAVIWLVISAFLIAAPKSIFK